MNFQEQNVIFHKYFPNCNDPIFAAYSEVLFLATGTTFHCKLQYFTARIIV